MWNILYMYVKDTRFASIGGKGACTIACGARDMHPSYEIWGEHGSSYDT